MVSLGGRWYQPIIEERRLRLRKVKLPVSRTIGGQAGMLIYPVWVRSLAITMGIPPCGDKPHPSLSEVSD